MQQPSDHVNVKMLSGTASSSIRSEQEVVAGGDSWQAESSTESEKLWDGTKSHKLGCVFISRSQRLVN